METDLFHAILQKKKGKVTETDSPTLPAFSPVCPPLPAVSSPPPFRGSLVFDAKARAATGVAPKFGKGRRPGKDRKQ